LGRDFLELFSENPFLFWMLDGLEKFLIVFIPEEITQLFFKGYQ
jgi:hypothetical protein